MTLLQRIRKCFSFVIEEPLPTTLTITVTQEHVNSSAGARGSITETCPIALAVKEMFPNRVVSVGYESVYIDRSRYKSRTGIIKEFGNMHYRAVTFEVTEAPF